MATGGGTAMGTAAATGPGGAASATAVLPSVPAGAASAGLSSSWPRDIKVRPQALLISHYSWLCSAVVCHGVLFDFECEFRIAKIILVAIETEGFAKNVGLDPTVVFAAGDIAPAAVAKNLEPDFICTLTSQYSAMPALQYRSCNVSRSFVTELSLTTSRTMSGVPSESLQSPLFSFDEANALANQCFVEHNRAVGIAGKVGVDVRHEQLHSAGIGLSSRFSPVPPGR